MGAEFLFVTTIPKVKISPPSAKEGASSIISILSEEAVGVPNFI